jgi:beta-1,4-mannosyl-glycoprotein beta-1,4-N-acetylglucosaminyltransferase
MKVYDSFLFFNELDLLEIRLNLLDPIVDYFIISESNLTFSGKPKPFHFLENSERFKPFLAKIIHQKIEDNPVDFYSLKPKTGVLNLDDLCYNKIIYWMNDATNFPKDMNHWVRDFYQRECLHRTYVNCHDEDVIIFSDVDEIPNPETVRKILKKFPNQEIYTLRQAEFNYYLNAFKKYNWRGPRITQHKTLKNLSLNKIRTILPGDITTVPTIDIEDGGWHFTSLGNTAKVIEKIESWGHQEYNTDEVKKRVEENIKNGKDAFLRGNEPPLKTLKMTEEHFPKWLVENQSRYQKLIQTKNYPFPFKFYLKKIIYLFRTKIKKMMNYEH